MAEKKYVSFILKLIKQTKEQLLQWRYLDENKSLCRNMDWMDEDDSISVMLSEKEEPTFYFDVENSFYCRIKENYIVLCVSDNEPAELFVIPSTFKCIVQLTPDEYGEHITRLLNLVRSTFPSGENFIDEFISGEN